MKNFIKENFTEENISKFGIKMFWIFWVALGIYSLFWSVEDRIIYFFVTTILLLGVIVCLYGRLKESKEKLRCLKNPEGYPKETERIKNEKQ